MSVRAEQICSQQSSMLERYRVVRARTERLCEPLSEADCNLQSMPDVSPAKWHLAHVSWFFEAFVLSKQPAYREFNERFAHLFNSYYQSLGRPFTRAQRGLLSRPSLAEVYDYRAHVDQHMQDLLGKSAFDTDALQVIEIGLNHEQQHQELLLMDIKHAFSCNPLLPAYSEAPLPASPAPGPLEFRRGAEGISQIGAVADSFCYDNETPRHDCLLHPHSLASRLISNAEYQAFIADGGYDEPLLWLADGWDACQREQWQAPEYWFYDKERGWHEFTLHGLQALDPNAPVAHLSYYEADAYARWVGARLPEEAELELDLRARPPMDDSKPGERLHPHGCEVGLAANAQLWQWTRSSYSPYPGYRAESSALGEYNGKFMSNQMVVRGAACITPPGHARASYRNFFYPHMRWQFVGLRLARDE